MKLRYKIAGGFLALLVIALFSLGLVLSNSEACGPTPELVSEGESMKAVVSRCYGPPETLEFTDVAKPTPGDSDILVRVHAAAVNPLDWHQMRGEPYLMRLSSGLGKPGDSRFGVDFSGTVESVGQSVTRFKPGDDVFGGRGGAFAEYVLIPEDRAVVLKPDNISFEEAAALPIAAITALQALRDKGQLQAGQKVLVNGASGGVGTYAVQIAKSMGAEVHGVCSARNVEMVRSIGADHVFDYKTEDYTESGQQYDLIIDNIGNHSPAANRKVLTPDGTLILVGGSAGGWIAPFVGALQAMVLSIFVDQELSMMLASMKADDLATLAEMMQAGEVTSVIDQRFALADVPAAIAYSETGRARGKIIINVD